MLLLIGVEGMQRDQGRGPLSEALRMFTRSYCREENQLDFKDLEEAVHHMTKDQLICDMAAAVGGESGCYGHAETENV